MMFLLFLAVIGFMILDIAKTADNRMAERHNKSQSRRR